MKLNYLTTKLYLFACFWVFFAVAWYFRHSVYSSLYTSIGLGYALTLFLLTYFIGKKRLWAFWVATILVGIGILISIFDEIGWVDVIYLLFSAMVFISLLRGKTLVSGKGGKV